MKHNISSSETEIVRQILICELCFDVCYSIPGFSGLGNHFLPYFYNLNFQRGLDSLHSLLLSGESNELSLKNYFSLYSTEKNAVNVNVIEEKVRVIVDRFESLAPFRLRNKIGSHLDGDFTHIDFTSGYLMPSVLNSLVDITRELKIVFFSFANHAVNDNSFDQLRAQIYRVIDIFVIEEAQKTTGERH